MNIRGKECEIDKSIVNEIEWLNDNGLFTENSCSGYAEDHEPQFSCGGYIIFKLQKDRELTLRFKNLESLKLFIEKIKMKIKDGNEYVS